MAEKTPGNIKYGDMTADFRMRYKQMLETRKTKEEAKKGSKKSKIALKHQNPGILLF